MKKILLGVAVLFISVQSAFASVRASGMDLVDIFGANQLAAGYDGREWDTALYSDFGTDRLRFSVNFFKIGGSWYNNGDINQDGTAVPFQNGLPNFFAAVGYKFSDSFRAAIGYGGALKKFNGGSLPDANDNTKSHRGDGGYYGNDISVFFQVNAGENIIRFATPIQFGKGFGYNSGVYTDPAYTYAYNMKNVSVFSMAPEIRWLGKAGPLVQVRFAVPFGMGTAKKAKLDATTGEYKDAEVATVGAELRMYFKFATDPVVVQFVPRIIYNQAIKGNHLAISATSGFDNLSDGEQALGNMGGKYYTAERPWAVRVDFPIDLGASSDIISVWGAPQLRFYAAGSPKTLYDPPTDGVTPNPNAGVHRRTPFYGIGYALPLELVVRPIAALEISIGMEVAATTPLMGGATSADAAVDGNIIWYF